MDLPQYPQVKLAVGGRPVIASGQIVLGRYDTECSVKIDDLVFTFVFVPDPGTLTADAQAIGDSQVRIRFTGHLGPVMASYELGGVAVWNGWWIDLAATVSAVQENAVVRCLNYTFTGGMRASGGLDV